MGVRPCRDARILAAPSGALVARASASMRPYEGAGIGRRAVGWHAPGGGPNSTVSGSLVTLRNRSRAGYRNSPWISLGIDRNVSNEIGCGIMPKSRCSKEEFRTAADKLFTQWTAFSDPAGELNFFGQQEQACRTRNMAGEVFLRLRFRRLSMGLPVPLQIQVLEPELVPENWTRALPDGNFIWSGIEFNRDGDRVAAWMYPFHPAEPLVGTLSMTYAGMPMRIPASQVIHHFLPTRPGQVRGEPVTVQSLLKSYTFDSYDDAELVRKQTRAPFTGFLEREAMTEDDFLFDPMTGEPLKRDADNVPTLDAQPGTIFAGMAGEKLNLFDGDKSGDGYKDFMRQQLLAIAAGMGVPYELMTGDWEKVNDRLVRAILNEYRRRIEALQDHLTIHQICRKVWQAFIDTAVWSGALSAPRYEDNRADYLACEWRPHAWPYVHPVQDIDAKLKAIKGSITSSDATVAETGWDAEEVDKQNIEAEKRRMKLRQAAGLPPVAPPLDVGPGVREIGAD